MQMSSASRPRCSLVSLKVVVASMLAMNPTREHRSKSAGSILLTFVVSVLIISPAANHVVTSLSFVTPATVAQSAPQGVPGPLKSSQTRYSNEAVNTTRNYSTLPAPVGIADYGVESAGGNAMPYKMALSSVTGSALLNNVSSSNGESLQLNVVMKVNTTTTSYVYWLQNVFSPPFKKALFLYPELVSSIWNWTAPYANMDPGWISGIHGDVTTSCVGSGCVGPNPSYYIGGERFSNYSLPLGLRLRINVSYFGSRVSVDFSNASAEGSIPLSIQGSPFDQVTISEPDVVTGAAILVDGYEMTPGIQLGRVTYYDAELVFGGIAGLETTTFTSMNSTIAMSYTLENGSVMAPLSVYEFGETGEKASNLAVAPIDQLHGFQFHVGIGKANSSVDYVRQPRTLDQVTASYSFPGGPPPGMASVLDYVNNGTETFAALGTNPATFMADAGTDWRVITEGLPSNSTVRWAPGPASGTVSGAQTIHPVYYRQFLIHMEFGVTGGGTAYSNPVVTFMQFGATTSAQAGSSVWVDAGTSYSFSSLLPGSTLSERWSSNDTSGAISGPGEIQVNYQHQYGVTIAAAADGSVSYEIGPSTGVITPGMMQTFYVRPGTEIALSATPASFWYGFAGWNGASRGAGSQIKETIDSPTSFKGEFSVNVIAVIGILAIVGVFLVTGAFLLRRRFHSPVRGESPS